MNQVAGNTEYGLVAANIGGQVKWIVSFALAVVHNGTVEYVR
jgi:hypothetical protein